jgi:hypothetical protein
MTVFLNVLLALKSHALVTKMHVNHARGLSTIASFPRVDIARLHDQVIT